jgi:hypothetical protein
MGLAIYSVDNGVNKGVSVTQEQCEGNPRLVPGPRFSDVGPNFLVA